MERSSSHDTKHLTDEIMTLLSKKLEGLAGEKPTTWTPPNTFNRSTTKYWVRRSDAIKVKMMILPHLPILGAPRSLISSIYLDNEQLSFYHSRLFREDLSSLIRIRWYGDIACLSSWPTSPLPIESYADGSEPVLYIERKLHREAWTGETSSKERCAIPISSLCSFLAGHGPKAQCHKSVIMEEQVISSQLPLSPMCLAPPPSPSTLHRSDGLDQTQERRRAAFLCEVQHTLVCLKASPILKTTYSRTAFQRSDTNAVRISFDEDVSMTAFSSLESIAFDYCILEIKLEDGDQDAPHWLQQIKKSGLLVECPKFSKYSHGISLLFPSKIKRSPSYFVKNITRQQVHVTEWRPATIDELQAEDDLNEEGRRGVVERCLLPRDISTGTMGNLGNNTEDGGSSSQEEERAVEGKAVRSGLEGVKKEAHVVKILPSDDDALQSDNDQGSILCGSMFLSKWIRLPFLAISPGSKRSSMRSSHAPALVRSRVEPKSFFANERTFLSWLQIAILLMFASLSLMGQSSSSAMGSPGSRAESEMKANGPGRIAGLALAPISIGLFVYALLIYRSRTCAMMRREAARYDDQRGPVLLVLLLVIVCSFVFALHIKEV